MTLTSNYAMVRERIQIDRVVSEIIFRPFFRDTDVPMDKEQVISFQEDPNVKIIKKRELLDESIEEVAAHESQKLCFKFPGRVCRIWYATLTTWCPQNLSVWSWSRSTAHSVPLCECTHLHPDRHAVGFSNFKRCFSLSTVLASFIVM